MEPETLTRQKGLPNLQPAQILQICGLRVAHLLEGGS